MPFVVSVNPRVKSVGRDIVDEWSGLEILTTTSELLIPTLLHTSATPMQVQYRLQERRIRARPDFIVNGDSRVLWAETVLKCLLLSPKISQ
jgi:hypothetical protein